MASPRRVGRRATQPPPAAIRLERFRFNWAHASMHEGDGGARLDGAFMPMAAQHACVHAAQKRSSEPGADIRLSEQPAWPETVGQPSRSPPARPGLSLDQDAKRQAAAGAPVADGHWGEASPGRRGSVRGHAPGILVAGIGCRSGCPGAAVVALVRQAEEILNRRVHCLAAPDFKRGEPGLRAAAAALGLPLLFIAPAALAAAQPRCVTRSAAAQRATGVASVAEGAALAASNGRLLLPRIGKGLATCAVAGL